MGASGQLTSLEIFFALEKFLKIIIICIQLIYRLYGFYLLKTKLYEQSLCTSVEESYHINLFCISQSIV